MEQFTILIADRSRHIREFLQRELVADGYRVMTAKDGREVLELLDAKQPLDLLILDLEIPYVSGLEVLRRLQDEKAWLPVLVHTFSAEYANHPVVKKAAGFWEKRGNNVDGFKATVAEVLRRSYPHQFSSKTIRGEKDVRQRFTHE